MSELMPDPWPPFDEGSCGFLADLSVSLGAGEGERFPDLRAFAFWCRAANLRRLRDAYPDRASRLGLGQAFHITAGNIPLGFAYSFAFGLLAGNANLVRLPSQVAPQAEALLAAIAALAGRAKYAPLGERNEFVRYAADDAISATHSERADARLFWGGDETVQRLRRLPARAGVVDLAFCDRHSVCVLDAAAVAALDAPALAQLAERFARDTLALDQGACSSPSLVFWLGEGAGKGQEPFWEAVGAVAGEKYPPRFPQAADKLTHFCESAARSGVAELRRTGMIFRAGVASLDAALAESRCGQGYFLELSAASLEALAPALGRHCQTLTYFGLAKETLRDFILTNRYRGVDRIVPVGAALEVGLHWDGYDVIRTLSRYVDCS